MADAYSRETGCYKTAVDYRAYKNPSPANASNPKPGDYGGTFCDPSCEDEVKRGIRDPQNVCDCLSCAELKSLQGFGKGGELGVSERFSTAAQDGFGMNTGVAARQDLANGVPFVPHTGVNPYSPEAAGALRETASYVPTGKTTRTAWSGDGMLIRAMELWNAYYLDGVANHLDLEVRFRAQANALSTKIRVLQKQADSVFGEVDRGKGGFGTLDAIGIAYRFVKGFLTLGSSELSGEALESASDQVAYREVIGLVNDAQRQYGNDLGALGDRLLEEKNKLQTQLAELSKQSSIAKRAYSTGLVNYPFKGVNRVEIQGGRPVVTEYGSSPIPLGVKLFYRLLTENTQ